MPDPQRDQPVAPTAPPPREFMLTFDDGPLPGKTDAVLAALSRFVGEDGAPVRAGFFMVGDAPTRFWTGRRYYAPYEIWIHKGSMRRHPDVVARVRAAGHLIGNHTHHHIWPRWPWYRSEARLMSELQGWEDIAAVSDPQKGDGLDPPKLFRTPYLANTPALTRVAHARGYQIVGGDTVGDASPEHGLEDVLKQVRHLMQRPHDKTSPVVLIFHDILPLTVNHLAEIIGSLQALGHCLRHFDPARLSPSVG